MTGFQLPGSLAYGFFKGSRLGCRSGSHLERLEFVHHSVAVSVGSWVAAVVASLRLLMTKGTCEITSLQ